MVNTLGNVKGMKETGVWDVVSYVSAVSGSCWAINLLYSIGEGRIEQTIQHVKSRIVTPFLDPTTIDILTNKDTKEVGLPCGILRPETDASPSAPDRRAHV